MTDGRPSQTQRRTTGTSSRSLVAGLAASDHTHGRVNALGALRDGLARFRQMRAGSTAKVPAFSVNSGPTTRRTDWTVVIGVVALTFLGIVTYGLDRADLSLAGDAFWGATLIVVCRFVGIRRTILQFTSLKVAAALFFALILWVLLSIGPWSPAGTLPVWAWVQGRSATLDRSATIVEVVRLLGLAATFVVGLALGSSDRRTEMFLRTVCTVGALYALVALGLYVLDPTLNARAAEVGFENRLTGTFFSANIAAGFFAMLSILMLSSISMSDRLLTEHPGRDLHFILQYGMLVLFLACLVLTASRMGTAGAVAGMVLTAFLHFLGMRTHDQKWRYLGPEVIGLSLFSALAIAGQLLISRFWSTNTAGNGRQALYAEHWAAFLHRPVSGYGLGSFPQLNRMIETPETFEDLWNVRAAHSVYLQWLEETGVIGAALMFGVIGCILFEIFQGQRQRQSVRWAMRAVLGVSLALLVHGFADFALQTPAIATFWALLLGVGFAAATGGHRSEALLAQTIDAPQPRVHWWAPVGLGIVVELLALVVLWGAGRAAPTQKFPVVLRSAFVQTAYEEMSQPAGSGSVPEIRRLAQGALSQSPLDAYAWMVLAQIDSGQSEAFAAFHQSYQAAPFDPVLFKWRITFAASHWDSLPAADRTAVMSDIATERRRFWDLRSWLGDLETAHQGQSFAFALDLVIHTADNKWPAPPLRTPPAAQATPEP